MGYTIIMNDRNAPSYPRSSRARKKFNCVREAEAAIRFEFSRCNWNVGTTASVITVKSNGQHGSSILTIMKGSGGLI
jgi:hypothetical protein